VPFEKWALQRSIARVQLKNSHALAENFEDIYTLEIVIFQT
jgi:hypothetical protein